MSLANTAGGFNVLLTMTQNDSSESMCILRKPLLKKTQNWSLQVTDFHINKTPAINLELNEQLRITPFHLGGFSAGYKTSDYIFTPTRCATVMEYVHQLQRFFARFNFLFWMYGIADVQSVSGEEEEEFITGDDIAAKPVNYTKSNFVPDQFNDWEIGDPYVNEGYSVLQKNICVLSLTVDLRLELTLSKEFFSNFYVQCEPHFQTRLGFPEYIFHMIDGNFDELTPANTVFTDIDQLVIEARVHLDEAINRTWVSQFPVRSLDDRMSLDVISTFPSSRKTSVFDSVQTEEYLLVRFDLSDYKEFQAVVTQDDDRMKTGVTINETYEASLENLTRGNPDYESNHLLSGTLQQVHLMLRTRYRTQGKIQTVKTDMSDGFWFARLLFSKKT